jgi:putative ABC transport system ATP-binding protein
VDAERPAVPTPAAATGTALVRIERAAFRWPGQAEPCLDIASFEANAGERLFLYGESGSGKSTLLALLGGVLTATSGKVETLGTDLATLSPAARDRFRVDHVGFLFQQFNLIPYLSVLDNVLLPCRFSARRRARALEQSPNLRAEAARLLEHLDLAPDLWHRTATQLSVGQQQRVAAARAVIGRPELVLADEPTSALDAQRQGAFLDLLARECAEARTLLIFVSHDMRLASHFSRVVALTELNRAHPEVMAA